MRAALTEAFRTRTTEHWLAALNAADILCARVANYDDVEQHPQVAANHMIADAADPAAGASACRAFRSTARRPTPKPFRAAPACGQDTWAVLRSVGYSDEEIAALRESRAVHRRRSATTPTSSWRTR